MKSPPYQVYWDLGKIDPYSVKTEEDEENYYKSLLYGREHCDRIEPSLGLMILHNCLENGSHTSHIYDIRQQEEKKNMCHNFGYLKRGIFILWMTRADERWKFGSMKIKMRITNFKKIILMKDNKSVYTSWSRK